MLAVVVPLPKPLGDMEEPDVREQFSREGDGDEGREPPPLLTFVDTLISIIFLFVLFP